MVSVRLLHVKLFPFPFLLVFWDSISNVEGRVPHTSSKKFSEHQLTVQEFNSDTIHLEIASDSTGWELSLENCMCTLPALPDASNKSRLLPVLLTYWQKLLGWPKSLFGFFHNSLWENLLQLLLLSRFSRVWLCDPTDGSPPGSPVPGILQARTLEWVATSFSNAWKWKVKVKSFSCVRLLATPWTAAHQAPLSMGFFRQEYWSGVPLPSPVGKPEWTFWPT